MVWIESHQELGGHPKTRRLSRLLGVGRVTVVGHLHFLWWWAVDYADDGDLSRFSDLDIALGSEWEGDEGEFVAALIDAGFLDPDRRIHDWDQYAGKLIERRRANAARMREARAKESKERATHVQRTQRARAERPNQTKPNQTEPDRGNAPPTPSPAAPDPPKVHPYALLEAVCDELGQDATSLSKPAKERQLAAAKRLAGAGIGEGDVRSMVRWLAPQAWVNGAVDMGLLEKQLPKWEMAGRPNGPPRASPAIVARPGHAIRHGKDIGYTNEELDAMIGRGRQ